MISLLDPASHREKTLAAKNAICFRRGFILLATLLLPLCLAGCIRKVNVRVYDHYKFDILVSVVNVDDSGKQFINCVGVARSMQNTKFDYAITDGAPIYQLQFNDANGKLLFEIKRAREEIQPSLRDNTWDLTIKP